MFENLNIEYKSKFIPEVKEGEAFWSMSLAQLTRHIDKTFSTIGFGIYEEYLKENAKDKTVCVLGCGTGQLLHIADYYGAKKVIGIDSCVQSCVYLKGMYPHFDIQCDDFFKIDWPEADIYIHKGIKKLDVLHKKANKENKEIFPSDYSDVSESFGLQGLDDYVNHNHRAYKELIRLNG